LTSRSK